MDYLDNMRDLRRNQETLISGEGISIKKFIFRWIKPAFYISIVATLILKPILIAKLIGSWVTDFFGTLALSINVEGIVSFYFILIVALFIVIYYLVNKWIKAKSVEMLTKSRSMGPMK